MSATCQRCGRPTSVSSGKPRGRRDVAALRRATGGKLPRPCRAGQAWSVSGQAGAAGVHHKADGRLRPLGVTTLEDKLLQRATVEVLNAISETDFLELSYGFRPGRSPHHALDALHA
jgi:hypothetical protein